MRRPGERALRLESIVCNAFLLLIIVPAIGSAGQFDKEWMRCVYAIQANHYAIETRGKVIEELMRKYAPVAQQASSREQFKKAVNDMAKEIGDSHFELLTTADQ